MAPRVCVSRCQILLKLDLTRFGLITLASAQNNNRETWCRTGRRYCTTDIKNKELDESSCGDNTTKTDVTVKYIRGLPHVTVPLPSRNERCQFALRPVSHNVGDFLHMLKSEDRGIDRATILNSDGVRIAAACSIENLMGEDFWLHVNDKKYHVKPPARDKITSEELSKMSDVRALVAQLYEALHVGEHQLKRERELKEQLEQLHCEISPMEQKKLQMEAKTLKRNNVLTWVGLGLMSVQFGILARLTWWEYSWDIMEPVTYFVTYGTAMSCYAYYCMTKQDYVIPELFDRQYLIAMHKKAKKEGLNFDEYNKMKRKITDIEQDLRRLRDPLFLHVPAPPPPKLQLDNFNNNNNNNNKSNKNLSNNNNINVGKISNKYGLKDIFTSATKRLNK